MFGSVGASDVSWTGHGTNLNGLKSLPLSEEERRNGGKQAFLLERKGKVSVYIYMGMCRRRKRIQG